MNSLHVFSNTVMGWMASNALCDVGDSARRVMMPTLKEPGQTPVSIMVRNTRERIFHPSSGRSISMSIEFPDAPGAVVFHVLCCFSAFPPCEVDWV